MAFAITMLPVINGQRVVVVEGDVDRTALAELRAVLAAATSTPRSGRLTVDISAARIHDEPVTACFAEGAAAARRAGVEFTVFDGGHVPTTRTPLTEPAGGLALAATA